MTWAETRSDRPAITLIKGDAHRTLTFLELHRRALEVAGLLLEACEPGDRVVLGTEHGLDYVSGFLGCVYAGVVAVTSAPPDELRTHARLSSLLADSRASVILSSAATGSKFSGRCGGAQVLNVDAAPVEPLDCPADSSHDDLMLLQYTSGSTSAPRGVMLSHGSIAENLSAIVADTRPHDESVYVSWLPLFHDMGLILMTLAPLYAGRSIYLLTPQEFLRHPYRWLAAITRFRGTVTAAPNFALRHCVERIPPSAIAGLDLSGVEYIMNGSEPIRVEDVELFHERFAPAGLRRSAMVGGYGMAEVSVYVCSGSMLDRQLAFDRAALDRAGEVRPAAGRDADVRLVAPCGAVNSEHFDMRIVEPATGVQCATGTAGEIWISGPSRGQGYWQQEGVTAQVFRGRLDGLAQEYLRTGDVGFVHDGQLYVCGRIKEMMIIRGRNLFPADICEIVENIGPPMAGRRAAAFTVPGPLGEELVIVCAARLADIDWRGLADRIVGAVTALQSVFPSDVVFVQNRALKRTTSGKVQHGAIRDAYLEGTLKADHALRYSGRTAPGVTAHPEHAVSFEVPTWLMHRICAVCSRICEAEHVDPEHNLFELGLDSLRGVRLIEAIETDLLGRKVPFDLTELVKMNTPKGIAVALARTAAGASEHALVEVVL